MNARIKDRLIGIRRGAALGLCWGAAWVPLALLIMLIVDPDDSMDEPWALVGLYPGFLCGAVFWAAAGMANGFRGLAELPLGRAGARGMVSGLLVAGGWTALVLGSDAPNWPLYAVVTGSLTLLSAVSGVATAWLARRGKNRAPCQTLTF